jgi:Sphingosine kinase and enzymes related to eukaryotic diacylglycerol kinase
MHYIFVVNGRPNKVGMLDEIKPQFEGLDFEYEIYITEGEGDATRFVNLHCDLNPKTEECFVACGGAGTANEVATALVNRENKYLALLSYTGTNDFTKCYPDRNFQSVKAILEGERTKIDVIRANDNYSINLINVGMDAMVAYYGDRFSKEGVENYYQKGLVRAVLFHRVNNIQVVADGKRINRKAMLLATIANGKYCGGEFCAAPRAVVDDGWMEVCVFRIMSLAEFSHIIKCYRKGTHLEDNFCKRYIKYCRAKHVELISKDLMYIGLDGEIVASSHFKIDILEKSLNIILPCK